MTLKKNDFIEIEFIAKLKQGSIFDTNIKKELKKLNPKAEAKPFVFCLGHGMFLKGVDEYLMGKKQDFSGKIELEPKDAFGKRDSKLVYMMPIKVFHQQDVSPVPGQNFNFDGRVGKILTVSGGRVMVDFNNPLSGKDVVYDIKILRKVEDLNEKIKALNDFFFRQELKFEVKDKTLIVKAPNSIKQFAEMFKDKYKDILGLDLIIEEPKEKANKQEKPK